MATRKQYFVVYLALCLRFGRLLREFDAGLWWPVSVNSTWRAELVFTTSGTKGFRLPLNLLAISDYMGPVNGLLHGRRVVYIDPMWPYTL